MSFSTPLLAVYSKYHHPGGVVPPAMLAQAAVDHGYRHVALVDADTLKGIPSFLDACSSRNIIAIPGMTIRLTADEKKKKTSQWDVFDYAESVAGSIQTGKSEPISLLALNRKGYQNLVQLRNLQEKKGQPLLSVSEVLAHREGLFCLLGSPGSHIHAWLEGLLQPTVIHWMDRFLKNWPTSRLGLGAFCQGNNRKNIPVSISRIEDMPGAPLPIAVHWCAYRNTLDRFWGFSSAQQDTRLLPSVDSLPAVITDAYSCSLMFQGLTALLKNVEKVLPRNSESWFPLSPSFPLYDLPRGTDTNSFFWTLIQEIAISTGHIRTEGGKERLLEEVQYLKQTHWPTIWLILWDLRRRLGFPPGTLSLDDSRIVSSLCAHLLGLTRVDPLACGLPFEPIPLTSLKNRGVKVDVVCPAGWEIQIRDAALSLYGEGHACFLAKETTGNRENLLKAAEEILKVWEAMDFPGNPYHEVPPLPSFWDNLETEAIPAESVFEGEDSEIQAGMDINCDRLSEQSPVFSENVLVISRTSLHQFFPCRESAELLDSRQEDLVRLGALLLNFKSLLAPSLASASRHRGPMTDTEEQSCLRESLSDWIERHKGKLFHAKTYAPPTGALRVLSWSSCLLRLLTLPSSCGYRSILWNWIYKYEPTTIQDLADLLALHWHWTHWNHLPHWRTMALMNPRPLGKSSSAPPWWDDWKAFVSHSGLDPKRSGSLGSALEKASQTTGGWILYQEQLEQILNSGLEIPIHFQQDRGTKTKHLSGPTDSLLESFLRFLGSPLPFPSRISTLRRAESLLMIADEFKKDPAAVWVMLNCCWPDQNDEKKEVYSLLRQIGINMSLPDLRQLCPYDSSSHQNQMTLGATNLLGVGPFIANEICMFGQNRSSLETPINSKPSQSNHFRHLYSTTLPRQLPEWQNWLNSQEGARLNQGILSSLIGLGLCDCFGISRESLIHEARIFLNRRHSVKNQSQQTLFHLETKPDELREQAEDEIWSQVSKEQIPRWQLESKFLRFPVTSTPLEEAAGILPSNWVNTPEAGLSRGFASGWIHAIDGIQFNLEKSGTKGEVSCLLFSPNSMIRIFDYSGLLEVFLGEINQPIQKSDGQRHLLKEPVSVICAVKKSTKVFQSTTPAYTLLAIESINRVNNHPPISHLEIVLNSGGNDLYSDLKNLLDWFSSDSPENTVPVKIISGKEGLFATGIRRMIRRFGEIKIVPTNILPALLMDLNGVASAGYIQTQKNFIE